MKLLRYGPAGHEKPGILDRDGRVRDLSGTVSDIGPDAISPSSLDKIRRLDPATLPAVAAMAPEETKAILRSLLSLRPRDYLRSWTSYDQNRGMSRWRDIIDWVGGYPFEVAKPDEIFNFYRGRGFQLTRMTCTRGLGCNEFVFTKS